MKSISQRKVSRIAAQVAFLVFMVATPPVHAVEEETAPSAPDKSDPNGAEGSPTTPAGEAQAPAKENLPVIKVSTEEANAPAPAPGDEATVLEDITVTSTKRPTSVRKIPATVVPLLGEDLEKMGAQGQDDFLKLVPAVTLLDDGTNARRITVRGIASDFGTNPTSGVLVGDIPFNDPVIPRVTLDPNPFDLASVEILKGPQGTLFGGSALNGAIRYVPQAPVFDEWETKLFAQREAIKEGDNGLSYGAAINIPAGKDLAFRVVGHDRRAPGWVDELQRGEKDVNEVKQTGGRGLALWQPTERWKITGTAMSQDTLREDSAFTDNSDGRLTRSNTPRRSPVRHRYDLEGLGIERTFDGFDFVSQTGRTYKRYFALLDDSRIAGDRPPPSLLIRLDNNSEGYTQDFRLLSNADFNPRWKWLAGGFIQQLSMFDMQDIFASDDPASNVQHIVLDQKLTERALFGEASYKIFDPLEVTLGLRGYRTGSKATRTRSGLLFAPNIPPGQTVVDYPDLAEQGVSPKFALNYTYNEHVAIYSSASRGFRFGGIQQSAASTTQSNIPITYKSDSIWAYELGLRTQWLHNTLIADLTPFYIDWKEPQLLQVDATGITGFIDNVSGVRSRGVELSTRYITPLPGLSLALSGSWVDAVTTEPFKTSSGAQIEPGTPWVLTPKWQSVANLNYQHTFGEWDGGISLTHTYMSKAYTNLEQFSTVFGYRTLDFGIDAGNRAWTWLPRLSATLSNLTDERGIVGAPLTATIPDTTYTRPRTLIVRLSADF